ncbi:hypothetical protein BDR05DRAFT_961458 [Suillus weaverae]|nr:hypothetical protein BDR05DRAFT_961458 [Suillus weaverae]
MSMCALTSQHHSPIIPQNLHPCVSPLARCDSAMVIYIYILSIFPLQGSPTGLILLLSDLGSQHPTPRLMSLSNYHVDTCAWMHPIFGYIELWNAFNTATCWPRLSLGRGYGARAS